LKSFVVLFGLSLLGAAHAAAPCKQPSAPDFSADTPIDERAERKLSRGMVQYISDTAKYVGCVRADDTLEPAAAAQEEYKALHAVIGLIDVYEARVGQSDQLVAEMKRLVSPSARATMDSRIAAAMRAFGSESLPTLNAAAAHVNAGRYDEARAELGTLDTARLTPFERSKAEQILYVISYREEDFAAARDHVQRSIAAGGLSANQKLSARLALTNIDVMLRLQDSTFERIMDERAE